MADDSVLSSDSSRLRLPRNKRWYLLIAIVIAVIIISRACAPAPIARPTVQEPTSSSGDLISRFGTGVNRNLSDNQPTPKTVAPAKNPLDDPEYQAWLRSKDDQSKAERESKAEEERKLREEALHTVSVISPKQDQGSDLKPSASTAEQQPSQLPAPAKEQASAPEKPQDDASPFAPRDKWDGPLHELPRGTPIPCTIVNQVNGSAAGPLQCIVSRDVYSWNSAHVLIKKYSKFNGEVGKVASVNQERLYASFNNIIMPDLFEYTMKDQVALSQEGEVGLRGKVDRHTWQIWGTALALAAIGGAAQIGNTGAYNTVGGQYRVGFTSMISESAMQILAQRLAIPPSFTVHPGARNILMLDKTIQLPEYDRHRMGSDL